MEILLGNLIPASITKNDTLWFQSLFRICFNRNDPWSQHIGESKFEAFHISKQAFILAYTVDDYTDILTIGVHPGYRQKGLASNLLKWLITRSPNFQKFFLDVDCQNTAAINLYKKIGFELISVRKGYYPKPDGNAIDALVMMYQKL